MALITLRQLLDHAAENNYGVPAFNVNNMEQVKAIMEAAAACDSPVLAQLSAGARKYAGTPFLYHLILAAAETWPQVPLCLHQDHGASPSVCIRAIQTGCTSVMMDGSLKEDMKTPATYEYNVDVTRRVAELAHACGASVEGELGCLGSLETGMAGEEDGSGAEGVLDHSQLLTDPDEAADFVKKTKVDALAIAIGTSHGAYKFTQKPTGKVLRIDRVKEIHARIPNVHLVMHGSSSVPEEWTKMINEYGGDIGQTFGVPVEEIAEGIRHGRLWRDAQDHGRRQEELRSAQGLSSGAKRHGGALQGPLRGLRLCRAGLQDQGHRTGSHEPALRQRRTRSDRQLGRAQGADLRRRWNPGGYRAPGSSRSL